jgi:hypothetical protein
VSFGQLCRGSVIGVTGILLTGLVAAVGVRALELATDESVGSAQGTRPARPHPSRHAPQGEPPADDVVERQVARGYGLTGSTG